jgi:hypothetical protein
MTAEFEFSPVFGRIFTGSISTIGILPVSVLCLNSIYNMIFNGPGLSCSTLTDNTTISIIDDAVEIEKVATTRAVLSITPISPIWAAYGFVWLTR